MRHCDCNFGGTQHMALSVTERADDNSGPCTRRLLAHRTRCTPTQNTHSVTALPRHQLRTWNTSWDEGALVRGQSQSILTHLILWTTKVGLHNTV